VNADIGHLNDPALSREALGGTVKPAVVQHSHTGWRLLPRHHQHPGRHRRLPLGDRRRTGQVCPGPHVLHDLVADKRYEVTFAGQQERITTVCRSPRWHWGGTCPTSSPIREPCASLGLAPAVRAWSDRTAAWSGTALRSPEALASRWAVPSTSPSVVPTRHAGRAPFTPGRQTA
jgi:hypothetical protein